MVKNYRPGGVGMVPAHAGTYLVHAYFDDNQVELVKTHVLGWQVGSERTMTPLVIDPGAITGEDFFVLQPDGRVECSDGRCWADVDTWVGEQRRLRRDVPVEKLAKAPPQPSARTPESPARSTGEASRDAA